MVSKQARQIIYTEVIVRTTKNVFVVIFAGGVGSRMRGAKVPKQFLELGGKPIIAHTIDHFEKHPMVAGVVVVCVASGIDHMREIVEDAHYSKVLSIVPGGETGQDSIFMGLSELNRLGVTDEDSIVLIHDGVRPLIDEQTITACIDSVSQYGPTATVAPSAETIIEEENGVVERVVDRSRCKLARAPQGFKFNEIYAEHLRALKEGRHDSSIQFRLWRTMGTKPIRLKGLQIILR